MSNIITNEIPFTTPDLARPGAGPGLWHRNDQANYPTATAKGPKSTGYHRLGWPQIEKGNGVYDFSRLKQELDFHIGATPRMKMGFGFMALCPGGCDTWNGTITVAGQPCLYPEYLHNLMQAEAVKDKIMGGTWTPNWNSNQFLARVEALLTATYNWLNTNSHSSGIKYKDAISYIEIRLMGSYGEWHHGGIVENMSEYGAMRPTVASYKRLIDAHLHAFPDVQPVVLMASLDANRLNHTLTPPEIGYYVLTATNASGMRIGIRRDQMGSQSYNDAGNYVKQYMETNNVSVNGVVLQSLITALPDYAPIVGEPENAGGIPTLKAQVQKQRINECGNGNFSSSTASDNEMREAGKYMGYRLVISGGTVNFLSGKLVTNINWKNANPTPAYWNWDVVVKLRKGTVTAFSGKSQFKIKGFMGASTIGDNFALPANITPDTYDVTLEVSDPTGFWPNMPLFIDGGRSDKSYLLGQVAITGGGTTPPNNKPLVNAGTDQTLQPAISEATVAANASDPDGTIVATSLKWEVLVGGGTIVNPNIYSTKILNIPEGANTYRFSVTDDDGDTSSDNVTITRLATVPPQPGTKVVTKVVTSLEFSDQSTQVTEVYTKV